MVRILALDLSTNPGWALYELQALGSVPKPSCFGELSFPRPDGYYPFVYLLWAKRAIDGVFQILDSSRPDIVVLEETTASSNSYSQKILEFLHFEFLQRIVHRPIPVVYVRDGVWKKQTGATQNAAERKHNAKVARIKKKTGKRLAKIDGKVVGRLDRKSYTVRAANEMFALSLTKKQNNTADAILLGAAFIAGVPLCDGTTKGGTHSSAGRSSKDILSVIPSLKETV